MSLADCSLEMRDKPYNHKRMDMLQLCCKWQQPPDSAELSRYLDGKDKLLYPEPRDVFPCDLIDSDHCRPPTSYPHN